MKIFFIRVGITLPWGHVTQLFPNLSEGYSVPITQLNNCRNTCYLRRVTSFLSGCDFQVRDRTVYVFTTIPTPTKCMTALEVPGSVTGKGTCGPFDSEQHSSGHIGAGANMLLIEESSSVE